MRMPSPSLSHLTRSLIALLAIALLGGAPLMPPAVQASETETIDLSSSQQAGRMLRLGLQKSAVLKLPAVVKDVIVGNPGMVDVVLKNRNTAYLFARAAGQTNIFFLDAAGQQILQLDVEVTLDTKALKALLDRAIPGNSIQLDSTGSNVVPSRARQPRTWPRASCRPIAKVHPSSTCSRCPRATR